MTLETFTITFCRACGTFWDAARQPAKCTAADHEHQLFAGAHRHRTPVVLPDGTRVIAVSFDEVDPYSRDVVPDYGLYLDHRWEPPWRHARVDWPDFGLPSDVDGLRDALSEALHRAQAGEHVELGCLGGHGRTGTALACLAVLTGVEPAEAVGWVRQAYCDKAVETPDQEAFVASL